MRRAAARPARGWAQLHAAVGGPAPGAGRPGRERRPRLPADDRGAGRGGEDRRPRGRSDPPVPRLHQRHDLRLRRLLEPGDDLQLAALRHPRCRPAAGRAVAQWQRRRGDPAVPRRRHAAGEARPRPALRRQELGGRGERKRRPLPAFREGGPGRARQLARAAGERPLSPGAPLARRGEGPLALRLGEGDHRRLRGSGIGAPEGRVRPPARARRRQLWQVIADDEDHGLLRALVAGLEEGAP